MKNARRYNALRNVPWKVMAEIAEKIEQMPEGNDKVILRKYFVDGLSSTEVIKYCEKNGIQSRNHTFYTRRSIELIVEKHFPEVKQYRKPNPDNAKRREHFKFIREHRGGCCELCGSTERIEWHHVDPVSSGGKTEEGNMMCVCSRCHKIITKYQVITGEVRRGLTSQNK